MWWSLYCNSTIESKSFFYVTLRSRDPKKIQRLFGSYSQQVRTIIKELIQIAYFLRGSSQYHDLYNTTYIERELMTEFIEARLKQESTKPFPVY